jgi:hypothetical protein
MTNTSSNSQAGRNKLFSSRDWTVDPVARLIASWNLGRNEAVLTSIEKVLQAMTTEGLHDLQDSGVQVALVPRSALSVWAYFPIYSRRTIVRYHRIDLRSGATALLVISAQDVDRQARRKTLLELAHHFGHALCYVRNKKRIHDCIDADRTAAEVGISRFLPRSDS